MVTFTPDSARSSGWRCCCRSCAHLAFCLLADLFHWWRCEASPRGWWAGGDGGAVCVCETTTMMMMHGNTWERLLFKHFVGHCVTTMACLQTCRSSLLNESREMGSRCLSVMPTEHKTNSARQRSNCAVNHTMEGCGLHRGSEQRRGGAEALDGTQVSPGY